MPDDNLPRHRSRLPKAVLAAAAATASAPAALPKRQEVPVAHTWDLSSLSPNDDAWRTAFVEWEKMAPGYERFKGKLGESANAIADCLEFDIQFERLGERQQPVALSSIRGDAQLADDGLAAIEHRGGV